MAANGRRAEMAVEDRDDVAGDGLGQRVVNEMSLPLGLDQAVEPQPAQMLGGKALANAGLAAKF